MPATALQTACQPSTSTRRGLSPHWALTVAPLLAIAIGVTLLVLALVSPDQAAPRATTARTAATSSTSVSGSARDDTLVGAPTGPDITPDQPAAESPLAAVAAAPPPGSGPALALSPVDRW